MPLQASDCAAGSCAEYRAFGQTSTPGYTVALQAAPELIDGAMTLKVKIDAPAKDAMLAQMITHPCLVVGVADPAVTHVRVLGENAAVLGEVDLK